MDKAQHRIERFGFKKTTMDELSRDCGISKKTIYLHFKDKEDLLKNLILRESQAFLQRVFAEVQTIADPLEKLTALINVAVQNFNQDNFITGILKEDEIFAAFVKRKYHAIIDQEIIAKIAQIIKDGKTRGVFREVNETVVAYAGFKLFQAFTYAKTGPLEPEVDYTPELVDFLVQAIIKPQSR